MATQANLAMSADFLTAYARLPKPQQKSVRELINKFNTDAEASGLNYERINTARDSRMRSLRIDKAYRAIVMKPDQGNVHLLLWADKHDDAYDWAARHECNINPETGAVQIYEPQLVEAPEDHADPDAPQEPQPSAFAELKDRELERLGVPSAMIAEVRGVRDDGDLDAMQARLPVEAYEPLFLYLAGSSYEELIRDREAPQEQVDVEDFAAALQRLESRARFVVAANEIELEEVLNAPLERWRVFLHPTQRRLVERHWNGPVRVLGGAGTGKTVVAMHRARWLARNLPGDGRILFTTFTRNLATDIANNLRAICSPDELGRIEVTNLDRWATRFLQGQRYDFKVLFGRDQDAWQRALDLKPVELDLPDTFYDDEWEQVVQANGVTSKAEYLRVPRTGRGTRLNRPARAKIWQVFEEYRALLAERAVKEVDDAYRDAAALLEERPSALDYVSVIVDEAQDMGAQSYRLIRNIVPEGPDDLFIVGDGHQRIYGRNKVVLGRCGIEIRGRSRKLYLNYRTTEETRKWASRLLEGRPIDDLDGGVDDNTRFKSLTHGPEPHREHFESREAQASFIAQYLGDLRTRGEGLRGVCIVTRTHRERDALATSLESSDVPVVMLDAGTIDRGEHDGVRIATMHRVKGLEFDRVIMASINEGLVPHPKALEGKGDAVERNFAETEERALVYVAATRAKKELLVLSFGAPSRFLGAT